MRTTTTGQSGGASIFFRYDNTLGAVLFNVFNWGFLAIFGLAAIYPFIYVFSNSISALDAVAMREVWLLPIGDFQFLTYRIIFRSRLIMRSYLNTIYYSGSGVLFSLLLLVITAYPLSLASFYGRRFMTILFVITMFFSGGLIPTYLVVRGVGFINTIWALIVPNAINVFYLIIIRTNFQMIPDSLRDSARIEGSSHLRILTAIILPLSKAVLATMFLFIIVGHWNSFFAPLIYIRTMKRQPLQVILRDILVRFVLETAGWNVQNSPTEEFQYRPGMFESLRAAVVIVATGPIILVYPFIQRYFVKGVLIGSIKG